MHSSVVELDLGTGQGLTKNSFIFTKQYYERYTRVTHDVLLHTDSFKWFSRQVLSSQWNQRQEHIKCNLGESVTQSITTKK